MKIYKTNEVDIYKDDKYVIVLGKKEVYSLMENIRHLKFEYMPRTILTKILKGLEKVMENENARLHK